MTETSTGTSTAPVGADLGEGQAKTMPNGHTDYVERLRGMWPELTKSQRQLILDLVWALGGADSALVAVIEDLEDERAYDAYKADPGERVSWAEARRELYAEPG